MPRYLSLIAGLLCAVPSLHAQSESVSQQTTPQFQLYGGYTFLSNSPSGLPGEKRGLNGWNASIGVPPWRFIRFIIDVSSYRGSNQAAPQDVYYIMGGTQFTRRFGRESVFLEGLAGEGGINRYWGPNASPGDTASFVTVLGGGLDTSISRRLALRVRGGYQWSNFQLIDNVQLETPLKTPRLPNNFWRISSGVVWSF